MCQDKDHLISDTGQKNTWCKGQHSSSKADQCPASKQVTLDTPSRHPLFLLMQFLLLNIMLFGIKTDPLVCFVYLAVSTALAQSDPAQTLQCVCKNSFW